MPEKKDISIKDYGILLPPRVGGYFIHETVGHLLEVDNLAIYNLKDKIKCAFLSVIDETKEYENFKMNRVELIKK